MKWSAYRVAVICGSIGFVAPPLICVPHELPVEFRSLAFSVLAPLCYAMALGSIMLAVTLSWKKEGKARIIAMVWPGVSLGYLLGALVLWERKNEWFWSPSESKSGWEEFSLFGAVFFPGVFVEYYEFPWASDGGHISEANKSAQHNTGDRPLSMVLSAFHSPSLLGPCG